VRKIGRGHHLLYHGTRDLPAVLRMGKLLPSPIGDTAVFFSRSPEIAVGLRQFSGGVLVLNRASIVQSYRLLPSRYTEDWHDEREESVWNAP
jgi:hypothetical protein